MKWCTSVREHSSSIRFRVFFVRFEQYCCRFSRWYDICWRFIFGKIDYGNMYRFESRSVSRDGWVGGGDGGGGKVVLDVIREFASSLFMTAAMLAKYDGKAATHAVAKSVNIIINFILNWIWRQIFRATCAMDSLSICVFILILHGVNKQIIFNHLIDWLVYSFFSSFRFSACRFCSLLMNFPI